ncbi:hypothetical protein MKW98_008584, partial [Papaver atlanticum]
MKNDTVTKILSIQPFRYCRSTSSVYHPHIAEPHDYHLEIAMLHDQFDRSRSSNHSIELTEVTFIEIQLVCSCNETSSARGDAQQV